MDQVRRIVELEEKIEDQRETILEKAEEVEYLNHKLEESEQARRELEKKLEEQQHEIWELQDLTEYLRDKLKESERERGVLVERIKELSTEYIVLYEEQRWRRQDWEPAPNDETPIICLLKKGEMGCTWHAIIQGRFINQFEEHGENTFFWRPLDLPENI